MTHLDIIKEEKRRSLKKKEKAPPKQDTTNTIRYVYHVGDFWYVENYSHTSREVFLKIKDALNYCRSNNWIPRRLKRKDRPFNP